MIFWSNAGVDRAIAAELKGKVKDPDQIHKQLQNGADVIDFLADGFSCDFVAVLISPPLDSIEQRLLGRRRVKFRDQREFPAWASTGSSASGVFGR